MRHCATHTHHGWYGEPYYSHSALPDGWGCGERCAAVVAAASLNGGVARYRCGDAGATLQLCRARRDAAKPQPDGKGRGENEQTTALHAVHELQCVPLFIPICRGREEAAAEEAEGLGLL